MENTRFEVWPWLGLQFGTRDAPLGLVLSPKSQHPAHLPCGTGEAALSPRKYLFCAARRGSFIKLQLMTVFRLISTNEALTVTPATASQQPHCIQPSAKPGESHGDLSPLQADPMALIAAQLGSWRWLMSPDNSGQARPGAWLHVVGCEDVNK